MAAAMEERCSREVICRDEAIGALKKENETLEAEKVRLSEEVRGLSSTRHELEKGKSSKLGRRFLKRGRKKLKLRPLSFARALLSLKG
jgi:hypothetical protein